VFYPVYYKYSTLLDIVVFDSNLISLYLQCYRTYWRLLKHSGMDQTPSTSYSDSLSFSNVDDNSRPQIDLQAASRKERKYCLNFEDLSLDFKQQKNLLHKSQSGGSEGEVSLVNEVLWKHLYKIGNEMKIHQSSR